jgi:hypothetical protein
VDNFGIQTLVHLCLEIWRKIELKRVTWNCSRQSAGTCATSRPSRHVGRRRTPGARARRGTRIPRSPRPGAIATVHLRPLMRANGLGRCHAASPHSPAGELPPSIGCRPPHVANRLHAHAVATVANEGLAKPPWSATGL